MKQMWKRLAACALAAIMAMGTGSIPAWTMNEVSAAEVQEEGYIFNYLYVECPVIYQNDEQVIGVNIENLNSHMDMIQDIRLGYTIDGVARESSYSEVDDNLVLFKEIVSDVGTYELEYVDVEETNEVVHFDFDDDDIAIKDAMYYVIEDACAEEEVCEQNRYYIDEGDGMSILTENGIRFELQEMNPVNTYGPVVVVIDPGHDKRHAGAAGNGLHEEELTLKIAKYCKEELETYNDVKVYLTHEDGTCLDPSSNGACLKARCNYAASLKANILVSIHIDAGSVTATGALVIVAKKGVYRDDLAQVTQDIGKAILDELTKLGLASRGLYIRMSDSPGEEYVYPNGATADYYAITRNSIKAGIPGIIVEHCFISNPEDARKYLSSDSKLRDLGVADATGIANYFKLSKKNGSHSVGEALYDDSPEPYEIKETNISDFVATVYKNALLRTPTRAEVSYWVRKIELDEMSGTQLVQYFMASPEFSGKNYTDEEYVERLYEVFLNRSSDNAGKGYWVELLKTKSRSEVAKTFSVAKEFSDTCAKYGMKQGTHEMQYIKLYPVIAEIVTNYYTGLMGRTPDAGGLEYWTRYIICGGSVSDLSKFFIHSKEFLNRDISKEEFVKGVYLTYLNREPDEAGMAYWIGKLGDMTDTDRISVIRGFVFSAEYKALCEKYGIHMGTL